MRRRAITVHCLDHARTALVAARDLDVKVTLASAPGAAAYLGAAVFREIIEAAVRTVPGARFDAVLDCGDQGLTSPAIWFDSYFHHEVDARRSECRSRSSITSLRFMSGCQLLVHRRER